MSARRGGILYRVIFSFHLESGVVCLPERGNMASNEITPEKGNSNILTLQFKILRCV